MSSDWQKFVENDRCNSSAAKFTIISENVFLFKSGSCLRVSGMFFPRKENKRNFGIHSHKTRQAKHRKSEANITEKKKRANKLNKTKNSSALGHTNGPTDGTG